MSLNNKNWKEKSSDWNSLCGTIVKASTAIAVLSRQWVKASYLFLISPCLYSSMRRTSARVSSRKHLYSLFPSHSKLSPRTQFCPLYVAEWPFDRAQKKKAVKAELAEAEDRSLKTAKWRLSNSFQFACYYFLCFFLCWLNHYSHWTGLFSQL